MIRITNQYLWNLFFLLFYSVFVVLGVFVLKSYSGVEIYFFDQFNLWDWVLIILATWRLTRLFTHDIIFRFFREQFWDVSADGSLVKPESGARRTVADLLGCVACTSVWMATTVIFLALLTPYSLIPIVILAVSALAMFLHNLSMLVANGAEYLNSKNKK